MRDAMLIVVDGMPGTGKSTTAQSINYQMTARGIISRWWHEDQPNHPVRLFYDRQRHPSWSHYADEAGQIWYRFARGLQMQKLTAVLDASILQNHVRSMLLFGCHPDQIVELVMKAVRQLASFHPVLIYLKPRDIEENFRHAIEVRGKLLLDLWIEAHDRFPYAERSGAKGYRGFINFWKDFDEVSERLFNEIDFSKIRVTVSNNDWSDRHQQILSFLNLPTRVEASVSTDLSHFVGKYVSTASTSGTELRLINNTLTISCDNPTMCADLGPIGCYRDIRLNPIAKNRFQIIGWPHEVEFTEDHTSRIVRMIVYPLDNAWSNSGDTFERA
jgi:hypothetical protein